MPTLLNQIETANWTLSMAGLGEVVTDIDDLVQCVNIILTTSKGTDPLRPTFGCDIWRYQDLPTNDAIPKIVVEILNGIVAWEARASVQSITYQVINYSNVQFNILLETSVSKETLLYVFDLNPQTPFPLFFTDKLTLTNTTAVQQDGISGISSQQGSGSTFEFNVLEPVGLPVTMNLRIGSLSSTIIAVIDYPSDYIGQPLRFTTTTGKQYLTNFPDPGPSPTGAIDFIL